MGASQAEIRHIAGCALMSLVISQLPAAQDSQSWKADGLRTRDKQRLFRRQIAEGSKAYRSPM